MSCIEPDTVPLAAGCVYMSGAVRPCRRATVCCPVTGLLVYGAKGRLLCYCPQSGCVVGVSSEPSDGDVTCLRAVEVTSGGDVKDADADADDVEDCGVQATPTFFATYSNGSAAVWQMDEAPQWQAGTVRHMLRRKLHLKGLHKGPVTCGDCRVVVPDTTVLIATTGLHHTIVLTSASLVTGKVMASQCYSLKERSLAQEVRLLPHTHYSSPWLLYGGDDSKLHVLAPTLAQSLDIQKSSATESSSPESDDKPTDSVQSLDQIKVDNEALAYEEVGALSGHQDWVTNVDFIKTANGDIMVASGSKDGCIRVWRLQLTSTNDRSKDSSSVTSSPSTSSDDTSARRTGPPTSAVNGELRVVPVTLRGDRGKVVLETVLLGHDGWLAHLCWQHFKDGAPGDRQLRLVSCAQTEDRAVVVWQPREYDTAEEDGQEESAMELDDDVWVESARLGEVGGNREGFFSAVFSPDGKEIYCSSYQGGLHQWRYGDTCGWIPQPTATGHFKAVVDIDWERGKGRYLLSSSLDQTTRLHAAVTSPQHPQPLWHEVCRPQVHGYDLSCVASTGLTSFVAGAEEKLLRAFAAPTKLLADLDQLCGWQAKQEIESATFVEAAMVPSLGLSNKSVAQQPDADVATQRDGRLTEDSLMAGSLWPEVGKLYGHGHELMCVTVCDDYIATACRAANQQDAAVIVWCSKTLQQVQRLCDSRLTVVQLCFSPDGDKLLAVSRDRSLSLYGKSSSDTSAPFSTLFNSAMGKPGTSHSRIVWAAAWLPNSNNFVTASRDKTVALWYKERGATGDTSMELWSRVCTIPEKDEVTAVDVADWEDGNWIMATGMVDGSIVLRVLETSGKVVTQQDLQLCHHDTVRRLAFRPRTDKTEPLLLASCSNDHLICIYQIKQAY